jgi:16S rRNA (guanine527-N7)-methyltransferase
MTADQAPVDDSLSAALDRHGVELPDAQVALLERYCDLLWDWNRKLNLTRHTDFEKFVARDLLDTLQLSAWVADGEEVLDLGSGGGVPGIVLAIIRPDLDVALCESVEKKARVLNDIVDRLELPLAVYHARVEDLLEDMRFDAVVARAVGPLWKICFWLQKHWDCVGRVLLIKGPRWVEERREARSRGLLNHAELRKLAAYKMPDTQSESVILKLWRKGRPEPGPAKPRTRASENGARENGARSSYFGQ